MGVWALKSYLESGGQIDTRDGYGTPVSEYVHRFGDYDTPVLAQTTQPSSTNLNEGIAGGGEADTLQGFSGDDTLEGRGGADTLYGGDGRDSLQGGDGPDDINGNTGDDTASGGAGRDIVVGGKDNDVLSGDQDGDIVWGNLGNDTLDGGDGDDQVRGGQGDDSLGGGWGDDFLSGDRGADTITGGAGADLFHTFGDAGLDRVLDFNPGEGDGVLLDPGTAYTVGQSGADTVISLGGGSQMVLVGVRLALLQPGWIFGA